MNHKFAFRVDASVEIGTGHVMRCLTLAEALREQGAACHFICRAHTGNLIRHIERSGFPVNVLKNSGNQAKYSTGKTKKLPTHASWLGCDWLTDAQQTSEVLSWLTNRAGWWSITMQ